MAASKNKVLYLATTRKESGKEYKAAPCRVRFRDPLGVLLATEWQLQWWSHTKYRNLAIENKWLRLLYRYSTQLVSGGRLQAKVLQGSRRCPFHKH